MDKKINISRAFIAVSILILALYYFLKFFPMNVENNGYTAPKPEQKAVVIAMNESDYIPNLIIIKVGQTVEWVNKSGRDFWPASNIHPTHSLYPGSSIFKCLTVEERDIFDACRPIAPGQSYKFTFKYIGEWRYHDHLRANKTGTIRVN